MTTTYTYSDVWIQIADKKQLLSDLPGFKLTCDSRKGWFVTDSTGRMIASESGSPPMRLGVGLRVFLGDVEESWPKDSQNALMAFDPATGEKQPYPSNAYQYREFHGKVAWLFDPWNGCRRDARDVGSDPYGQLIVA